MFSPQALYDSNLLKKYECYSGPRLAPDLTLTRKTLQSRAQSCAHTSARALSAGNGKEKNGKVVKVSRQLLDSDSELGH